jgi:pilus assembly protein FimV
MNRPLKLSLAVALALASSQAFGLGLGPIEVKSKMNEPLSADIVVLEGSPDETTGLRAQLAGAEDMKRVGVDSSGLTVPLDFTVMPGPKGRTVIHVTSTEPIRDPYISFLIEVNWGKGKLLREYNVLLDPPVVAPVIATRAVAAPIREPERAAPKPAAPPPEAKPAPAPSRAAAGGEAGARGRQAGRPNPKPNRNPNPSRSQSPSRSRLLRHPHRLRQHLRRPPLPVSTDRWPRAKPCGRSPTAPSPRTRA